MGRLYDAFVEVGPRFTGFGDIKKQGDKAGNAYGKALADAAEKAAKANVKRLGEALAKARSAEADAAGKVRVEETRLAEARKKYGEASSQAVAAEERLAAAQRKAASSSDAAKEAADSLGKARERAAEAAKQSGEKAGESFNGGLRQALQKTDSAGRESGQRFGIGFSKTLPAIGGRVSSFFKTGFAAAAGLAAGAVVGGGFAAGFGEAMSQGSAKAKLQGQLGLSDEDAKRAGKIAGDLFTQNYGDSLENVNEAVKSVVQNTNVTLDSVNIRGVTAKVLDLATTFDQDLGGVTRAVGQLMRTGLVKNANEALDVLTVGFQSGANKADDLVDTLNEYPTQFRKLGLDAKQATGILSQGLKAGARDSDLVADALKEFSIRAVDGSKTTADGFKKLGLSAKSMSETIAKGGKPAAAGLDIVFDRLRKIKDPVKQSQIAVELFGTQAEDLGAALYAIDPSTAVDALGQVAGAAGKLDQTLGTTPQAVVTSFFRTLKQKSVDSLGGVITAFASGSTEAKGFQGVIENAAVGVRTGFDKFSELGGKLYTDAKAWGGSIISGIKNGIDTGDWKPLGESVGTGIATGLRNIDSSLESITAAIGGLIDKVDWASLGQKTGDGISSAFRAVDWKTLGSTVGDALINAIVTAKSLGQKFGGAFKTFMDSVDWEKVGHDSTNAIGRFLSGVDWKTLGLTLGKAVLGALKIDSQVKDSVYRAAVDLIFGMFKVIIAKIEEGRLWVVAKTKELGLYLWGGLKSGIVAGAKGIGSWLKSTFVDPVVSSVKSFFGVRSPSTVFAWIGTQLIAGFTAGIAGAVRGIGSWLSRTVVAPVVGTFSRAGTWLAQHGRNFVAGFKNGVSQIAGGIGRWMYDRIISPAVAPFRPAGTWLNSAGRNVIAGFKNGMVAIWGDVTKWVSGIATWIKNNKGPVSLDGRLLIPAGQAIMSGFLKGLKSGAGPAWDFVKSVGGKTVDMLRATFGAVDTAIGSVPLGSGMAKLVQSIAANYGWGSGYQWDALSKLIQGESGFRPNAQNPTSSAYGLFQFLDSTWGTVGGHKTADPTLQTIYGLRYIQRAYGSPAQAFAAWSSRSPHWYGDGGIIPETVLGIGLRSGRAYGFGERGPETVVPNGGTMTVQLSQEDRNLLRALRDIPVLMDGRLVNDVVSRRALSY